jgi:hypothetical protein
MIELIRERLAAPQEAKLRQWLAKPEADLLRKVLAAECQFAQSAALQQALHAKSGDVSDLLSRAEMDTAAEYDTALKIIEAAITKPIEEHFHIARLKTTTDNANTTNEPTD